MSINGGYYIEFSKEDHCYYIYLSTFKDGKEYKYKYDSLDTFGDFIEKVI